MASSTFTIEICDEDRRRIDALVEALKKSEGVSVRSRYCTGIHKEWWYQLQHDNGCVDSFAEWEIDRRYAHD